jgi:putative ABC transport system permease protein
MSGFVSGEHGRNNQTFRLALRFALRELRGGLKGFYIFIACIALGVAAISGVTSVSRALTEGISQEGQAILGGDLSFRLVHRQVNEDERNYIGSLGAVSEVATLRAMARRADTADQALVELKAVDDVYPLYGALELQSGQNLVDALRSATGAGELWPNWPCWPVLMLRLVTRWSLAARVLKSQTSLKLSPINSRAAWSSAPA